jgi:thiamine phosphate synthase YjbQ (UPF0047 family)
MQTATFEPKSSIKLVGVNGQISIGKQHAGRQVLIEEREPGVWMLRTALVIPDNERWLHAPQAQADLQASLVHVSSQKAQVTDLASFAKLLSTENNHAVTRQPARKASRRA